MELVQSNIVMIGVILTGYGTGPIDLKLHILVKLSVFECKISMTG